MILLRRGLTLIELLVVLAVCVLIVSVLSLFQSTLSKETKRERCMKNLRGLVQLQYIYAQDDPGTFVNIGRPRKENDGKMTLFDQKYRTTEPPLDAIPSPTRDLWMLLRSSRMEMQVSRSFVCPITKDQPDPSQDYSAYYDFAGRENLSYAYYFQHDPYVPPIGPSSNPAIPIMADGNPYLRGKIDAKPLDDRHSKGRGNSTNHGRKKRPGQNVLFLDGHVTFMTSPGCGLSGRFARKLKDSIGRDNIYTSFKPGADALVDPGDEVPTATYCNPGGASDAVLVP